METKKRFLKIVEERTETNINYTITDEYDNVIFSQSRYNTIRPTEEDETFVDKFVRATWLIGHKRSGCTCKIVNNRCELFDLIAKRRSKRFNFKQKLFYFFFKKLFMNPESSSVTKVK